MYRSWFRWPSEEWYVPISSYILLHFWQKKQLQPTCKTWAKASQQRPQSQIDGCLDVWRPICQGTQSIFDCFVEAEVCYVPSRSMDALTNLRSKRELHCWLEVIFTKHSRSNQLSSKKSCSSLIHGDTKVFPWRSQVDLWDRFKST